jgi:lysophospholipase L1-like esterase
VVLLKKINVLSDSPFPRGEPAGHVSDLVDQRVVEIFSANLDILLRECRAKNVRVVLLPHVLSPEVITDANYKWWAPFLTKKGIFNALDALNAVMRRRADGDWVIYASFLDGTIWGPAEFCDPSHLNSDGNQRLARLLEKGLPWRRLLGEEGQVPK